MTIILEHAPQLDFFADMSKITEPFKQTFQKLNWLVTDLEFISHDPIPQLNNYRPSFEFTGQELSKIIQENRIQFIWGVFSGFEGPIPAIPANKLPYADQNKSLWTTPEEFQISAAEIEIVCWDSSLAILKFKSPTLASEFLKAFPEAKELKSNTQVRT